MAHGSQEAEPGEKHSCAFRRKARACREANLVRSLRKSLLVGSIPNECGQSADIINKKFPVSLLEDSDFSKAIEFAGNGLAMGTRAARDFSVRGRWNNFRRVEPKSRKLTALPSTEQMITRA
jgi:hypothetical protein